MFWLLKLNGAYVRIYQRYVVNTVFMLILLLYYKFVEEKQNFSPEQRNETMTLASFD